MLRKTKWWVKKIKITFMKFFRNLSDSDKRLKKPKKINSEENHAISIWSMLTHNHSSELFYNPENHECYVEYTGDGGPVYIFLESRNMRIINTTVIYDIRLSAETEQWCTKIFNRELNKRRTHFKNEAFSKANNSLERLHSRLNKVLTNKVNND